MSSRDERGLSAEDRAREAARRVTRRAFFGQCGLGLGTLAFGSLFGGAARARGQEGAILHHAPKAKNVIFLFMAGGPSQIDLFDPKPKLRELDGEPIPPSLLEGARFAFIDPANARVLPSPRTFSRFGESGVEMSELVPHIGGIADDICLLRGMQTDVINHGPAKLFVNTGARVSGRPSMGSWVVYALGSENDSLPGFVVLLSGSRGPNGSAALWNNGFLSARHQGVALRSDSTPVLNVESPPGFDASRQGQFFDAVRRMNQIAVERQEDDEIRSRIEAYEMAHRMQVSAPELTDLADEPDHVFEMYGAERGVASFALNCLLARRMVERGVRFIQLYHPDWDHHGRPFLNLGKPLEDICREVDQPSAALVKDLKQRGLLDETLVVWGGEFGRTPMREPQVAVGRDHHIDAYTMWLAGGGTRPGIVHGVTDELGYSVVEGAVHVHDLQATILHQLGIDHTRLTHRFQGRDFRLTDVAGEVVHDILA